MDDFLEILSDWEQGARAVLGASAHGALLGALVAMLLAAG